MTVVRRPLVHFWHRNGEHRFIVRLIASYLSIDEITNRFARPVGQNRNVSGRPSIWVIDNLRSRWEFCFAAFYVLCCLSGFSVAASPNRSRKD